MVDYKIKGTPLPTMKDVYIRLSHWGDSREPYHTEETYENLVSFGSKVIHGEIWILSEREIYTGYKHYMFKLDDIKRLAGQADQIVQTSQVKLDFTVVGTEIPKVKGIPIRLKNWDSDVADLSGGEYSNFVSYGSQWVNGELWVLCDYKNCASTNYYMFKLEDLNKIAGQGNLIPAQSPAPQSVAPQASGDGPIKLIKTKVLKINLVE